MIKFNEVTWYSKLAAAILFIFIVPALTFYIGSEYGKVKEQSSRLVSVVPTPEKTSVTSRTAPVTDLKYFTATTPITNAAGTYSNIVGYFASGNFFFYVPQWIPDHWKITNMPNGGMEIALMEPHGMNEPVVDFSNILIYVSTTTESNNAETLYSRVASSKDKGLCISDSRCEVREEGSTIVTSEIFLSTVGDTRIYHLAEATATGMIKDTFYIDGNKLTATITFSAQKGSYPAYETKIREFIQGIGKGEGARG